MTQSPYPHSTASRFNQFIKSWTLFPLLLPVFFVLHGFNANHNAVNAADAALLIVLYVSVTLIFGGLGWFFYRNIFKAAFFAFMIMAFHFFFGVIQDVLTTIAPRSIFPQYRFLLPVSCLLVLTMTIWLKKTNNSFRTITTYLNIVFVLLIAVDAVSLLVKMMRPSKPTSATAGETFNVCDKCSKPDVYFILLDQYAGNTALKEVFNFDNGAFESALTSRGFHIAQKSKSNYNLTPFSMASTLNMDYLGSEMGVIKQLNVTYSYDVIRKSRTLNYLNQEGYAFTNLSVFDFPGQPAHKYGAFLPYGTDLITAQTFTSRVQKALRADVLSGKIHWKSWQQKIMFEHLHFNDDIFELTKKVAAEHSAKPKFVYTHFIMPHWPYYYDSKGHPVPPAKLEGFKKTNAGDYIEYLQYSNGKVLELVDHIFLASPAPPVIILLGDHGFRNPEKSTDHEFDFFNLNAIFLPAKNYDQFKDDITNVNFFRVFFNSCFNQHFSLLKDSTVNLWE